jgi:hypothetical protein
VDDRHEETAPRPAISRACRASGSRSSSATSRPGCAAARPQDRRTEHRRSDRRPARRNSAIAESRYVWRRSRRTADLVAGLTSNADRRASVRAAYRRGHRPSLTWDEDSRALWRCCGTIRRGQRFNDRHWRNAPMRFRPDDTSEGSSLSGHEELAPQPCPSKWGAGDAVGQGRRPLRQG